MIIFLRAEENIGGEKKINGDANQVDPEGKHLLAHQMKINTCRFGSIATRWG